MKTFKIIIFSIIIAFTFNDNISYSAKKIIQQYREKKERILNIYNNNMSSVLNYKNLYCNNINNDNDFNDCDLIDIISQKDTPTKLTNNEIINNINFVNDIPKYINYFNNETYDLVLNKFANDIYEFIEDFIIKYKLEEYNISDSEKIFYKKLYNNVLKINNYIKNNIKYNINIPLRIENIGQLLFNNKSGSYELFEIHDLIKRKIAKCSGYSKFVALILFRLKYDTNIILLNLIDGAHEIVQIYSTNGHLIIDPTNYQVYNNNYEKNYIH